VSRVTQAWAQLRRWTCSGCQSDFVYLARGSVEGVPALIRYRYSGPAIVEAAHERIRNKLRSIEASKHAGRAACPGCGQFALWMRFPRCSLLWTVYGVVLGLTAAAIVTGFVHVNLERHLAKLLGYGALGLGPLLGGGLGYWLALRAAPIDTKALSWDDFEAFRAEARARGVGLEDAWLQRQGAAPGAEALSARLAPGCKFE